jgi:hypothetical protein
MCKVDLSRWRLLRLLLERVKNYDRIRLAHIIENPHRRPFSPYTQFVNSGRNHRHRTAERHPKINSFLKVSKRFSDMTSDRRRLCSYELQCSRMKIDRFHDVIMSPIRDISKEIVRLFFLLLNVLVDYLRGHEHGGQQKGGPSGKARRVFEEVSKLPRHKQKKST